MTTASPRAVDLGRERLSGGFDPSRLKQQFPIFQSNPGSGFPRFRGQRAKTGFSH